MSVDFSVVVPVCNEAENVEPLAREIDAALNNRAYEMIFVNDGSTDETAAILKKLKSSLPALRVLSHSFRSGQSAAVASGVRAARAPWVATLDGDGQNDPADVPAMLQRLSSADMVVGIRAGRRDSWLRKTMSRVANAVRRRWLRDGVSDTGCALKVFRREVIDSFLPIRTLYSFMPAFAAAAGFRVVEQPVAHRPRRAGTSKYGLLVMLWRPLLDMMAIGWFVHRRIPRVGVEESKIADL